MIYGEEVWHMQDINEVIWGDMGQEVVANMSQSSGGMDYSPVWAWGLDEECHKWWLSEILWGYVLKQINMDCESTGWQNSSINNRRQFILHMWAR